MLKETVLSCSSAFRFLMTGSSETIESGLLTAAMNTVGPLPAGPAEASGVA